jgi:hypothetical protein
LSFSSNFSWSLHKFLGHFSRMLECSANIITKTISFREA